MTAHETLEGQIAAYLMDALDVEEQRVLEHELVQHLPGCPDCVTLMRELRETAGDLALDATPVAPTANMEARIRAAIASDRVSTAPSRRTPVPRRMFVAAMIAALVAIPMSWSVSLNRRLDAAEGRAVVAASLTRLLTDPASRTIALEGDGTGMTFVYRPGGDGILLGDGVEAPPGKVLEVWFIRKGTAVPSRIFTPSTGPVIVPVAMIPAGAEVIALTVEDRYETQPTSTPILAGTLV